MWKNFVPNATDEETVSNAFCTNGLFRISSESEVTTYPQVQAQVQNKRMLLCVDNSIILLQDENVMECNLISFGAPIDCLAVSQSGNVIVCALADGNIHGIFIKGIPIFNLCVKEEDLCENSTFVGIKQIDNTFYIMCRNGVAYRLYNIDEKLLENYSDETICENESRIFNETILRNTVLEKMPTAALHSIISSYVCVNSGEAHNPSETAMSFILTNDRFIYFEDGSSYYQVHIPEHFEGIKTIHNLEHMIVCLSSSGQLFEICPITKTLFHPYHDDLDYRVDDFIILESNEDDIELLLLTKPNELGNRLMKIVEFPSMKCKSDLNMPQHTWLVQQPKTAVNMYYLAGCNFNELDLPCEIEMKIISETQPKERLKRLITKNRLDEAEEFGRQFNLDLQPICEAKAKRKLMEISLLNENDTEIIDGKFTELMEILKTIENNNFFLGISALEIPSRCLMERFLNEILTRCKDVDSKDKKYQQNIFEIKERLLRLETLNIIDPYETNMQWQKFVHHPNIAKVCLSLFKTDFLSACIVWKRHAACIVPFLNVESILKLLNAIPQITEAFYVVQWLRYFVPSVLQIHPDAMSRLVEWSIQKTRSLQYSSHWPDVGLEFSTNILNVFESVEFLYSDFRRQYESNIGKLNDTVNVLQDLSVLKKSYNLVLTLDNYVKDSLDDTALRVLQGVHLSNLKKVTSDFLYPIYFEKGRTPANAIKKYINYLVTNRKSTTFWVERSVIAINLLHNEEEKLQSALLVLKNAPVPWPEALNPLLKLSSPSHPLAAEIQAQYDLQTIKLLKAKYGWPDNSTDSNMKLIFRIVKIGLPEMIEDVQSLVKVYPEIASSSNFYCCYELAKNGQIQEACAFLNGLEEKQRAECSEKITNILTAMFSSETDTSPIYDNLFEFLKIIARICGKESIHSLLELRDMHHLRTKFEIDVSADDFKSKSRRAEVLSRGVDVIMQRLSERKTNVIHFIWSQMSEISRMLRFNKLYGVLIFAQAMNDLEVSCALAYYILNLEEAVNSNYEYYIDFAALIVCQYIEVCLSNDDVNTEFMAYPLVYKLLIEALKFSKVFQMEILEFLKWVRICNEIYSLSAVSNHYEDFSAIDSKIAKKIFGFRNGLEQCDSSKSNRKESISIFEEISDVSDSVKPANDPTPVVKCVSMALFTILSENNCENFLSKLKLFMNPNCKKDYADIKTSFLSLLEHLVKCKQYNSWYTIVQCTLKYQTCNDIIPKKYILMYKMKMFKYLLSQKEPNFTELFCMLLADSNPEATVKYLEHEIKAGQSKLNFLILLEMYNTHIGDGEKVAHVREQRLKYFYYTELIKQDSALKCKGTFDFISIAMLMKELKNKILDLDLLKKLSTDFDWDYQQVLVEQIITLLSMQEPSYEIRTDALGKEEIVVKTSADQIREMCQPYLKEITNTGRLASELLRFVSEINFYFYELYLCVIDILTYMNSLPREMGLWGNILQFLKHKMITKRRHRANQIEMDWWLKSQLEVGVLPKIAKYRFPFTPLIQEPLKNILDDEVNVDNCESWFPLIKLHTVNQGRSDQSEIIKEREYFCMSAVKNSISEYKQLSEEVDTDKWHLHPINNAFLQSIVRLIRHMTSSSKILFILYFVTNHAPEGADQVEAAAECYKFAIQYEKELASNKKAEETVSKIKRKYPLIKTQHLLHIYGLIDEKLLQLAENPKDLIYALYHHESILKSPKSDINSLASEIAKLHHLEDQFHTLQVSFLQNWLSCTNLCDTIDVEDTIYENFNVSLNNIDTVNDEHIIRAHYILNSWKPKEAIEFLIGHMFPVDGSTNTAKQLQIFECFSKLIDESSASYVDLVSQKQYVVLKCVHYLKQLGYNYTVEKFPEYNKVSIMKRIWKSHASNPVALEAISYICIGHDIYDPEIWNGVLKQMVNLNMVSKLNALIDVLSCKPSLLYINGLVAAWECVLRAPFKNANRVRCREEERKLADTLFKIQACPLVKQLNLIAFTEDCIRLDRPYMAAIFVSLANKQQRDSIISIVEKHKHARLKDEIIELEEVGIASTLINFAIQKLKL